MEQSRDRLFRSNTFVKKTSGLSQKCFNQLAIGDRPSQVLGDRKSVVSNKICGERRGKR
jgi:hypothetical protein